MLYFQITYPRFNRAAGFSFRRLEAVHRITRITSILMVCLPVLCSCGGSGDGDKKSTVDGTVTEQNASNNPTRVHGIAFEQNVGFRPGDVLEPSADSLAPGATDQPLLFDEAIAATQLSADCNNVLPCSVLLGDLLQLSIARTFTDEAGLLQLVLVMEGSVDTRVLWQSHLANAVNQLGDSLTPVPLSQPAASTDINQAVEFNLLAGFESELLQGFRGTEGEVFTTLPLLEFGLRVVPDVAARGDSYAIRFQSVPLTDSAIDAVDCALNLPCSWHSADGAYAVTLVDASGVAALGRLRIGYTLQSLVTTDFRLSSGTTINVDLNDDYVELTPRLHGTTDNSVFTDLVVPLRAGGRISGFQDYLKTAERRFTRLPELSLGVVREDKPSMGLPAFVNVPVE